MRCPNTLCGNENVDRDGDLVSCDECQGQWTFRRGVKGGLVELNEPRGIVEFVHPEVEDLFGHDNLGDLPSTVEQRRRDRKASKWR